MFRRNDGHPLFLFVDNNYIIYMTENTKKRVPKTEIKYSIELNEEQKAAKREIYSKPVTFLHGNAGSGKTITACYVALNLFFKREKDKIIITRPTVATEDNGFLPGTFQDKLEPWLVPIRDNLRKIYNYPEKIEKMLQEGQIEIVALTHFRGRTFDSAVCIVDEYQNLTYEQLKMCIGRLGKESIMIFCGDIEQIDLKNKNQSAVTAIEKLKKSSNVTIIELKENHRHSVVAELLTLLN